ncbi:PHA/PHB synthase family protein [Bermanella sp. WJH001]|uniref:PHA/PHB synthase family protein n=1 Tax=Bermanella sp. WJH001 TaxID=3048005 RepID=UPI0024BE264A|nr:class I poly(R)-hydroxyalkanoic acid synthase [Bermanella sp. WJH001]MDJ1536841.1 class I poly(R)-hydroxyalkanoic acid synthase [Bermanella sp. WJH001]
MTQESLNFQETVDDFIDMSVRANEQFSDILERLTSRKTSEDDPAATVMSDFNEAFSEFGAKLLENPSAVVNQQMQLMTKQMTLWQQTALKFMGQETVPVIEPDPSDRRFKDDDWSTNPLYDFLKQNYLLHADAIHNMVESVGDLSELTKNKVDFLVRQYVNALSPSNFAGTNPEVVRKTFETGGANLIKGMEQLSQDLKDSFGGLNIAMSDSSAFKVGSNVATTPGSVVFENDLIQLIQYTPTTKKTFKTPLLVIPPFINKYYILDLREKNSFLKWLVDQGHTVFCISWVNPGPSLRNKGFADYMSQGPLAALDAIKQATGESDVNAIGYCLGGTLLASTLGYMKKTNDNRIKSATYLATLIDFSDPGEIGVFINETAIGALEKQMNALGYYDGRMMAFSFNLLRENDLFWSFFINNYLKGERPMAFDLLYWNTDGTNLPAAMHSFYLRNMYLYNKLKDKNGIELNGKGIDLTQVDVPTYFLSLAQDHIAKWETTYKGASLFKGDVKFVLGGSGHIAGVVNPPSANKYGYWTNEKLAKDSKEWFKSAKRNEGSWWTDWQTWVNDKTDGEIPARSPDKNSELKVIEPAPGRYVTKRIIDVINK